LPGGVLLNVNVPYLPYDQIRGLCVTRQGLRLYRDSLVERDDPRGRPYYWIGGEAPSGVPEPGTDFGALAEGWASITPLHLDLTDHPTKDELQNWDWPE
jgi:5'-nucleotidase